MIQQALDESGGSWWLGCPEKYRIRRTTLGGKSPKYGLREEFGEVEGTMPPHVKSSLAENAGSSS